MIPWVVLGNTQIPNDGGELTLSQRGHEFSIRLSGIRGELMNSRAHSSEEALARLGCSHLKPIDDASILVGGLGMGFTLAAALMAASPSAQITVAELLPAVVEWNRGPLGECAGRPLLDNRTRIHIGDVTELFNKPLTFDAILLDVDNGPEGLTVENNNQLYSPQGLKNIYQSLRPKGMLAIWSAQPNPAFIKRLINAQFKKVCAKMVRAHAGKGSRHTIFLGEK